MYKLLIVEDEHLVRNRLQKGINWRKYGFQATAAASNGREALEFVEANPPNVVISDIKMPEMDGIELARSLKSRFPAVRVILLSCYSDFVYAQKAIEYGVYAYILKPVKEEEIGEVLVKLYNELEFQNPVNSNPAGMAVNVEIKNDLLEGVFLKLLTEGVSNIDSYRKRLEELSFVLHEQRICVMVFACECDEKLYTMKSLIPLVMREASIYWKGLGYPLVFGNGVFYVLAHEKCNISYRDILYRSKQFKSRLEDRLSNSSYEGISISIGVGKLYPGMENIGASAREAEASLKHRFFKGKGTIISFDMILEGRKSGNTEMLSKEANELIRSVSEGNVQNTLMTVKRLLLLLSEKKECDVNFLLIKCVEMYASITAKIKESNLPVELLSSEDIYYCISRCETFPDLCRCYEKYVTDLAGQVEKLKKIDENLPIAKIKKYIDLNYGKKLSLRELSEQFALSAPYISMIFKEETGLNITDYILNVRMGQAKSLLKKSDMQIGEIADKIGFTDYRHFCTVFKKEAGVTPLQYRLKSIL